jgi:hypothetical protein
MFEDLASVPQRLVGQEEEEDSEQKHGSLKFQSCIEVHGSCRKSNESFLATSASGIKQENFE